MDNTQADNHPAIQQLVGWVNGTPCRGIRASNTENEDDWEEVAFVSAAALDEYLSRPKAVEKLLAALFSEDDPLLDCLSANQIRRNYPRILCLLIFIGKGKFINHFVQNGINDQRLPLRKHEQPIFPTATLDPHFFESFYQNQWQFCVPELQLELDRRYDLKEWILPIQLSGSLGEGGSATSYKIKVQGSYDRLDTDSHEQQRAENDNIGSPRPKFYVLKSYRNTRHAEKYYDSEWKALKRIHHNGPCPHVIGFYGSFVIGGVYNILLEYADKGTLEKYLATIPPPCTPKDILAFWDSFSQVTLGLFRIHHTSTNNTEGPQIFQGWHQDIKPSNILIKSRDGASDYAFECKLADLGLSHFKRSLSKHIDSTSEDTFGTRAYGAPDCFRFGSSIENEDISIKRDVDVWSLGCVLSEVATWAVCNWNNVLEYRQQRQKETQRKSGFRKGDCCFHDGHRTLSTVNQNHNALIDSVRSCDNITKPILKMVEDDMLRPGESEGRRSAKYLVQQVEQIIQDAKAKLVTNTSSIASSENSHCGNGLQSAPLPAMLSPQPPTKNNPLNFNTPSQPPYGPNNRNRDSLALEGSPSIPSHYQSIPHGHIRHWSRDSSRPSFENAYVNSDCEPVRALTGRSVTLPHRSSGIFPGLVQESSILARENFGNHNYSPSDRHASRGSVRHSARSHPIQDDIVTGSRPMEPGSHHTSQSQGSFMESQHHLSPPVTPPNPNRTTGSRDPPPVWPVHQALHWRAAKRDKNRQAPKMPNDRELLESLKGRDHAFLIDNSSSMEKYWSDVRALLDLLAYIVKTYDPNGIDLHFTSSAQKYVGVKSTTDLLEIFDRYSNRPRGSWDMSDRLSSIVSEYQKDLATINTSKTFVPKLLQQKVRPLSLYVLTDAVWQPACDVSPVIESLVSTLKKYDRHKQQVGIQFIRFGSRPEGIKRLEDLDMLKLNSDIDMDVVDTEPSNGSVWKMLFGAINMWFDNDPIQCESTTNSPPSAAQTPGKRFSTPS